MIFKALGTLRGTALKAAQMMSLEMEMIPEIYRKEMGKAASRVPPLNRALIRKIIRSELGGPPEDVFAVFEATPFAAASLGQVHRAVSHSGDELAVKVQYPGMAAGVKSDIDMLKTLLRPSRYYRIFRSSFGEIEERISEELDYEKEAENTAWFHRNIKLKDVIIPEIYPEYSTSRVITTAMIHGEHMDTWLKRKPSRESKNRYGQILVDLFNYCIHEKQIAHADPNPGNYLFREDGKLGVIDFGCVKRLRTDFIRSVQMATDPDFGEDPEKIKTFYRLAGIHFNRDFDHTDFNDFIHRWIGWVTRPEREGWFSFDRKNGYFDEGLSLLKDFYRYIEHFEGAFIYFGRSFYGLRRLLQSLGARVDMRLKEKSF